MYIVAWILIFSNLKFRLFQKSSVEGHRKSNESTWLKKQTQKQQSPTTTWFVYKNYLITMLNTAVNDAYARQSGPIPYITSLLEAENPILNMKIEETLF